MERRVLVNKEKMNCGELDKLLENFTNSGLFAIIKGMVIKKEREAELDRFVINLHKKKDVGFSIWES